MDLYDLIVICRRYRDLGDAVGEQIDDVLDGTLNEANPNALRLIRDFLAFALRHTSDGELQGDLGDTIGEVDGFLAAPRP